MNSEFGRMIKLVFIALVCGFVFSHTPVKAQKVNENGEDKKISMVGIYADLIYIPTVGLKNYHVKDLEPSRVVEIPETSESFDKTGALEKNGKGFEGKGISLFSSSRFSKSTTTTTSTSTSTVTSTSTLSATFTATRCTTTAICSTAVAAGAAANVAGPTVITCNPSTQTCEIYQP